MKKYADHIDADRRLSILLLLAESTGYEANEELLRKLLGEVFAHTVSIDRLRIDLDWLGEQGLVRSREAGGLRIATLTARGGDVSAGRANVTGVQRPRPRSG
jgi:DNA-binding transcriptional ArsR family regulator